jgi:hypothetical protein
MKHLNQENTLQTLSLVGVLFKRFRREQGFCGGWTIGELQANAKIKRFVTFGKYADDSFLELFNEAGVEFEVRERPPAKITYLD